MKERKRIAQVACKVRARQAKAALDRKKAGEAATQALRRIDQAEHAQQYRSHKARAAAHARVRKELDRRHKAKGKGS